MSKASEWAIYSKYVAPFRFDGWRFAEVKAINGQPFCIVERTILKQNEALALARWILDTFGETSEAQP